MAYTVGSLFSGIGGIDLAFDRAGFSVSWQVEINDYCNQILERHWPHVQRWPDVRTANGHHLCQVDVVGGGFPCTNLSVAGNGEGLVSGLPSGLWSEFARLIGDLQPSVVFVENVPTLLSRDGTTVLSDLARLGYDARWGIISAYDAGADHLRKRLWIVAYAQSFGRRRENITQSPPYQKRNRSSYQQTRDAKRHAPLSGSPVLGGKQRTRFKSSMGVSIDGFSPRLAPVARQGQPQLSHEPPRQTTEASRPNWRNELQALGNAVVPQVVYPIAVTIREWLEAQAAGQ